MNNPEYFSDGPWDQSRIQTKGLFDRLNEHLEDKTQKVEHRLNHAQNVTETMGVCMGGLMTSLQKAVKELDANKKGLPGVALLATTQILENLALDYVRRTVNNPGGNEVHYANAHINAFAKTVGLPQAELGNRFLDDVVRMIPAESFNESAEIFARELTPYRLTQFLANKYADQVLDFAGPELTMQCGSEKHDNLKRFLGIDLFEIYGEVPDNLLFKLNDEFTEIAIEPQHSELALLFLTKLENVGLVGPDTVGDVLIPDHPNFGSVSMLDDMVISKHPQDGYKILGREDLCKISLSTIDEALTTQQSSGEPGGLIEAREDKGERTAILSAVVQLLLAKFRQELADHSQQPEAGNTPADPADRPQLSEQWLGSAADFARRQRLSIDVTQPLLELAIMADLPAVFGTLKGSSVNFDMPLSEGLTALSLATDKADTSMLEALISAGANVNAPNADGKTAVMHAINRGHTAVLPILFEAGADVTKHDNNLRTALMYALIGGHTDVFSVLIKKSVANLDHVDRFGCTALMYAAMRGHLGAITELQTAGVNVNYIAPGKHGLSAAMWAADQGQAEALTVLLIHGANRTEKRRGGHSLLMLAASNNHVNVIRALAPDEKELQQRDRNGRTPLEIATAANHTEAIAALKELAARYPT